MSSTDGAVSLNNILEALKATRDTNTNLNGELHVMSHRSDVLPLACVAMVLHGTLLSDCSLCS
jgi:hypothetical protein